MNSLDIHLEKQRPTRSTGRVFLVGAGPGDPELMTVRGLRLLKTAEVLIYDRLVSPELIAEAPEWAEKIFVGKRPGDHALPQDEINALIVERALLGQTVVRLKGGDPFIFGRGGEEAIACLKAGVLCEVVPGISSSAAVPAGAGIPLTHRGIAGSFAVMTAHRAHEIDGENPVWEGFAKIDTLVILMGVARLQSITENLIHHGRAPQTPVAIVERGTLPDERITIGTLTDIAEIANAIGVRSPATIIVGEVVHLRAQLAQTARQAELDTLPDALMSAAAG